jgi:hypothetical protein
VALANERKAPLISNPKDVIEPLPADSIAYDPRLPTEAPAVAFNTCVVVGVVETVTAPVDPLTLVTPPLPAVVALVAVAAFPLMLMPHVPEASPPVLVGTLRFVLAAASLDAPVPPLVTGTAFTRPSVASS